MGRLLLASSLALVAIDGPTPAPDTPQLINEQTAKFVLQENSPKEVSLQLQGAGGAGRSSERVVARIAQVGAKTYLLPIYQVHGIDASRASHGILEVQLNDLLYDVEGSTAVEQAMEKRGAWETVRPCENFVEASIFEFQGGRPARLATAPFTRMPRENGVTLTFKLDPAAAARIRDRIGEFGLSVVERFEGRFTEPDLIATSACLVAASVRLATDLGTDRSGAEATLLVRIGGSVHGRTWVENELRKYATIEILTREGRERVNDTLVDALITKMVSIAQADAELSKVRDESIVTFILANGARLTMSVGTYKGLRDASKEERKLAAAGSKSDMTRNRERLATEVEAFSARVSVQTESDRERQTSSSYSRNREDLREFTKAIEGELPIAALDVTQVQALASRMGGNLGVEVGRFRIGKRLVEHKIPLRVPQEIGISEAKRRQLAIQAAEAELRDASHRKLDLVAVAESLRNELAPHEARLADLRGRLQAAQDSAAARKGELETAEGPYSAKIRELTENLAAVIFINREVADRMLDQAREKLQREFRIDELRANWREASAVADGLEGSVASVEATLPPLRDRHAAAEKQIADQEALIRTLEAKLAALRAMADVGRKETK